MKLRYKILLLFLSFVAVLVIIPFPKQLFNPPTSSLLYSQDGNLIEAEISTDGQWRFPANDSISDKFKACILQFEDSWFYYHPGINPVSVFRALVLNIKHKKVVSGGSTITMQVARMMNGNAERTVFQKCIELLYALKLELFYSKEEILLLYCNNAPFGGNTVGIEAAAWRYFGRSSSQLSWAENAALAVLPNAPALVFPGKNEPIFLAKRNRLLQKLQDNKIISKEEFELAILEQPPGKPRMLPSFAPHLLQYSNANGNKGKKLITTLNSDIQNIASQTSTRYQGNYTFNGINNIGILVLNTYSGEVLAYLGNYHPTTDKAQNKGLSVDMIQGKRSTGSILKPLLFAGIMQDGTFLPQSLVEDLPTSINGYSPTNFNKQYSGAVPINLALSRSLNIPSVRLLKTYHAARFLGLLKSMGFTTFKQQADHYGLSLILGGGEVSLWELCGVYSAMGRSLQRYLQDGGTIKKETFRNPNFLHESPSKSSDENFNLLSAGAIHLTFDALRNVVRPQNEAGWEYFDASNSIAWKTGTSFGFRDAWAVGVTNNYTIGVWVGNASGEGKPGLVGGLMAAPILFDLFRNLPDIQNPDFQMPFDDLRFENTCRESGMLASAFCTKTDSIYVHKNAKQSAACNKHSIVNLHKKSNLQANLSCATPDMLKQDTFFILSPGMEYYYAKNHPEYRKLPGFQAGCTPEKQGELMEVLSPTNATEIVVPRELDGSEGKLVIVAAHRKQSAQIFWHLDGVPIGNTITEHVMDISPETGNHLLVLVDDEGNSLSFSMRIVKE